MRILIVDDSKINRMVITTALQRYGDVESGRNGLEGLEKFKKALDDAKPYDLICLDYKMPVMDGHETLLEIRKHEEAQGILKGVVVIMVSSTTDRQSVMKIYQHCQGYIVKPFSPEKLYEKLRQNGIEPCCDKESLPTPKPSKSKQKDRNKVSVDTKSLATAPYISEQDGEIFFLIRGDNTTNSPGDFKRVSVESLEHFQNVSARDAIARLGRKDIDVTPGHGVHFLAGKGVFIASKSGRVIFSDNTLSILEEIVIDRVLRHENIEFTGRVVINGDVRDGVTVDAVGGITLNGAVGACTLRSEGDIKVDRMDGKSSGVVVCGGDFLANFIYDTSVESEGAITVEKESVNSILKSKSTISAMRIIGGECIAGVSIVANKSGNSKGVLTCLTAGVDYKRYDDILKIKASLKEAEQEMEKLVKMLGEYADEPCKAATLPESRCNKIYDMVGKKLNIEYMTIPELQKSLEEAEKESVLLESHIEVKEMVFAGVTLKAGLRLATFKDDSAGRVMFSSADSEAVS